MHSLKEWATVVRALENGDQTVILRKGGILETDSGFRIESKKFLLFPTYEHQEERHIKEKYQKYLQEIKENTPREGYNKITSYAEAVDEVDVDSDAKIKALSKFHIWSDEYIASRRNWMPEKPLKAIFLKVFTIPEFEIPILAEYQGCKSWININSNVDSAKSVLSNDELGVKLLDFEEILG